MPTGHEMEIDSKLKCVTNQDGKMLWKCGECLYISNRKFNTQAHVEAKHLSITSNYRCPHCDHICFTKNAIRKHLRRCNKNLQLVQ